MASIPFLKWFIVKFGGQYMGNHEIDFDNKFHENIEELLGRQKLHEALGWALCWNDKSPGFDSYSMTADIMRDLRISSADYYYKLAMSYGEKYKNRIISNYIYFLCNSKRYSEAESEYKKIPTPEGGYSRAIHSRWPFLFNEDKRNKAIDYFNGVKKDLNQGNNCWFIFNVGQMGDVYLVCSLMKSFKEDASANLGISTVRVGIPAKYLPLAKMFLSDDEIFFLPENYRKMTAEFFSLFSGFSPGVPILAHPKFLTYLNDGKKRISRFLADKMKSMNHFITMLDLPSETKPAVPCISKEACDKAEKFVRDNRIDLGKSVLICPHANSIDTSKFDRNFWIWLIEQLKNKGLHVYRNIGPEGSKDDWGVRDLDIPLDIVFPVVDSMGFVVSVRSGLCDVLLNSDAKKIILYPDKEAEDFINIPMGGMKTQGGCLSELFNDDSEDVKSKITEQLNGW